ncbi:MAG: hypothetical protein ACC631_04945, partial [Halocynthiibacter sp.]
MGGGAQPSFGSGASADWVLWKGLVCRKLLRGFYGSASCGGCGAGGIDNLAQGVFEVLRGDGLWKKSVKTDPKQANPVLRSNTCRYNQQP